MQPGLVLFICLFGVLFILMENYNPEKWIKYNYFPGCIDHQEGISKECQSCSISVVLPVELWHFRAINGEQEWRIGCVLATSSTSHHRSSAACWDGLGWSNSWSAWARKELRKKCGIKKRQSKASQGWDAADQSTPRDVSWAQRLQPQLSFTHGHIPSVSCYPGCYFCCLFCLGGGHHFMGVVISWGSLFPGPAPVIINWWCRFMSFTQESLQGLCPAIPACGQHNRVRGKVWRQIWDFCWVSVQSLPQAVFSSIPWMLWHRLNNGTTWILGCFTSMVWEDLQPRMQIPNPCSHENWGHFWRAFSCLPWRLKMDVFSAACVCLDWSCCLLGGETLQVDQKPF